MIPVLLGTVHSIGYDLGLPVVSILVEPGSQTRDAPQWVSLRVSMAVARELKLGDKLQITAIPEISE